jgi:hypothetical protein
MTKIKRKRLAEGSKPDVKEEKYEHATLRSEEVKRIIRGEYLPEWKKDAPEPTSRLRQGKPKLAKKGWK